MMSLDRPVTPFSARTRPDRAKGLTGVSFIHLACNLPKAFE
jgi:hypothetical protein